MNDGVLTSADFMRQKIIEEGKDKNPTPLPVNGKFEYKFMFEPAPMGKSSTVIIFEDKSMKIELTDKIYIPPKNWSINKKEKFKRVITLVYGFKDVSIMIGGEKIEEKIVKKKMIYKIGHPDNTVNEKINGSVSIKLGKKSVKFDCINGTVSTENKAVFEAFLKKGWYQVSIKEKEEG